MRPRVKAMRYQPAFRPPASVNAYASWYEDSDQTGESSGRSERPGRNRSGVGRYRLVMAAIRAKPEHRLRPAMNLKSLRLKVERNAPWYGASLAELLLRQPLIGALTIKRVPHDLGR
jgi:hypothetical protein